ncbi:cell division protein FtsZ [Psychroflexus sp. ALD_RP9]|uniref:cell division protein FtsZ n=1 Tax=Psychroflexus sp. ALD_RP9 TaxID=2777186 RepID=UPI001A8D925E|nr:cell division protein FtsZ [Psychroflexus sp. ALD_RP9]QSS96511.1 cell division protein FtsZ [Psychroflexus sp. ALD_RP9]
MGSELDNIAFDLPKNQSNVIKVIGVGGGGSNAINHMFSQGIKGVDFVICNTDAQALESSPVPNKIQLGVNLTEGLGAGANPEIGKEAAQESSEDIKNLLGKNTKMVFVTAGMGGGTGTGAAPVIAQLSRDLDILTVGIVTIPFQFEGKTRNDQAQLGVEELRRNVDSLIVINNNKLREVYGNLGFKAGFSKADEVLATASRGIAEVITHHYTQNIDLRDAKTVLSNSGTAIMGSGTASGTNRSNIAIEKALDSPLLNDNKITGAQNVLLLIVSGKEEITIDEIGEINDHIQAEAGNSANIIMGVGEDESLEESISVTVIATGFNTEQQDVIVNTETKKIIHTLEDEQKVEQDLMPKDHFKAQPKTSRATEEPKKIIHTLNLDEAEDNKPKQNNQPNDINEIDVDYETVNNDIEFEIHEKPTESETQSEQAEGHDDGFLQFDLNTSNTEETIKKERQFTAEEISQIEVHNFEEIKFQPKSEHQVKRYNLEDFEEEQLESVSQKTSTQPKKVEEPQEENLFTTSIRDTESTQDNNETTEVDPFNSSISELAARAEERRAKMKQFNYKFNRSNNIDDIEKQPAYKRAGVELKEHQRNAQNMSRTSLESNEDGINFKSNNSFLHDNVD